MSTAMSVAARRSGILLGVPLLCVLFLLTLPAGAAPDPGGTVTVQQSCDGWSARVELNHKVAPFRVVNVISTIPGHPGIVDGSYDSSFGLIWTASGSEHDIEGTVILTIVGSAITFEASASIHPAEGCEPEETTTTTTTTTTVVPPTEPTLPVQGRQDQPTKPDADVSVPGSFAATGSETAISLLIGLAVFGWGIAALQWSRREG